VRSCFEATAFAGLLLAAACGGGDGSGSLPDPGPTSGIDPSTPLDLLTPAQATTLCQWTAGRIGGYSRSISCGNGNYLSSESSAGCDSAGGMVAGCTETVRTVEACVNGVVDQAPCTGLPIPCINLIVDCGTIM
jgi:hypothetical protein